MPTQKPIITLRPMTAEELCRAQRRHPPIVFTFRSPPPTAGEIENEVVADAPELAVRVSHPQQFVEQLFVAAWRPVPNPGGVPAREETRPNDDELIQELRRLADPPTYYPDSSAIAEQSGNLLPGDCWGKEALVTRPLLSVGPVPLKKSVDVEREFFVGLLREKDLFLFVRADRHGRVSLPQESPAGDLTAPAIRQRTLYIMETALAACREQIIGFTHGDFESVQGLPDRGFRPFVRSLATKHFRPASELNHAEIADAQGRDLAAAAGEMDREIPRE